MELKDFVATTLKEIYAGLDEAAIARGGRSFSIWPNTTNTKDGGIKFDLAISSGNMTESAGKAGVGLKVHVLSAEAAKEGKLTYSAETSSRIMFVVNP